MNQPLLRTTKDGIVLAVRAAPKASASRVSGVMDGELKVSLHAPPADGRANRELIAVLSKTFSIPKSQIEILSGETSRKKTILFRDGKLNEIESKVKTFS